MYSGTSVWAGHAHWQSTTRWYQSGCWVSVGFKAGAPQHAPRRSPPAAPDRLRATAEEVTPAEREYKGAARLPAAAPLPAGLQCLVVRVRLDRRGNGFVRLGLVLPPAVRLIAGAKHVHGQSGAVRESRVARPHPDIPADVAGAALRSIRSPAIRHLSPRGVQAPLVIDPGAAERAGPCRLSSKPCGRPCAPAAIIPSRRRCRDIRRPA